MSKCNCQPSCLPTTLVSLHQCPDCITNGNNILVSDDNCCTRSLIGEGIAYRSEDVVSHTDGSDQQGVIKLNPKSLIGAKGILATLGNGELVQVGRDAPDGSVLVRSGGVWTYSQLTEDKTTFSADEIISGNGTLASLICGSGNTLRLGTFTGCKESFLYFNADRKQECLDIEDMSFMLNGVMCKTIPAWTDANPVTHIIVCTANGLEKKAVNGTVVENLSLTPMVMIYKQCKAYVGFSPAPSVIEEPDTGPCVNGYFETNTIEFNLPDLDEWDDRARYVRLLVSLKGIAGTSTHDIVCRIEGVDYARISTNVGDWDTDTNQVVVKIPSNKKIKIQGIRQDASGTPGGTEVTGLFVFLQEFLFS